MSDSIEPDQLTFAPAGRLNSGSTRPVRKISSLPARGTVVFQDWVSGSNDVDAQLTDWKVIVASGTL